MYPETPANPTLTSDGMFFHGTECARDQPACFSPVGGDGGSKGLLLVIGHLGPIGVGGRGGAELAHAAASEGLAGLSPGDGVGAVGILAQGLNEVGKQARGLS